MFLFGIYLDVIINRRNRRVSLDHPCDFLGLSAKTPGNDAPSPDLPARAQDVAGHDGAATLSLEMAARQKAELRLEILGRGRSTSCPRCGQLLDHQGAGIWLCGCGLKKLLWPGERS